MSLQAVDGMTLLGARFLPVCQVLTVKYRHADNPGVEPLPLMIFVLQLCFMLHSLFAEAMKAVTDNISEFAGAWSYSRTLSRSRHVRSCCLLSSQHTLNHHASVRLANMLP